MVTRDQVSVTLATLMSLIMIGPVSVAGGTGSDTVPRWAGTEDSSPPSLRSAPTKLTVQGFLADSVGIAVDGELVDFEVRLWDAEEGGTELYMEAHPATPVNKGSFTLKVGESVLLDPAVFAGGPLYFGISVVGPFGGGGELPRTEVVSAPFSIRAQSADVADGVAAGAAVTSLNGLTDGVTVVGGGSVTIMESADSLIISAAGGAADTDWLVSGDDMYAGPTGSIGIGTSDPKMKVHIVGDLLLEGSRGISTRSDSDLQLGHYDPPSDTFTERMRIVPFTGWVGIGTPSPQALLQVAGDALVDGLFTTRDRLATTNENDDTVFLVDSTVGGGPVAYLYDDTGIRTMEIDGYESGGGGQIRLFDPTGTINTIEIDGYSSGGDGLITTDRVRSDVIEVTGDATVDGLLSTKDRFATTNENDDTVFLVDSTVGGGPVAYLYDDSGIRTMELDGYEDAGGGQIKLFDATGTITTIEIDGHDSEGKGRISTDRVITDVLEITGGSDLAEPFASGEDEEIEPGTIMVIGADGRLEVADRPSDVRVAGVVSGGNGIRTGITLTQEGREVDGDVAIALTGRTYCKADASFGSIRPGDFLTTSSNPGHAMRVASRERSAGAILGKALSSLETGTGYVLVLVNLQ